VIDVSIIEETIEVDAPLRTVYNQWTQFEEFPKFMEGVEQIIQLDDEHLHWKAKIAGQSREWDARITEQRPDELIAWVSEAGAKNDGIVAFQALDPGRSRIVLQLDVEPEGFMENVADGLGLIRQRAHGDLKRFKEFIEERSVETGAWRGQIN